MSDMRRRSSGTSQSAYAAHLPPVPEGSGLVWSCVDIDDKTVRIRLTDAGGRDHGQKTIAVDLYGPAGVREAGQWLVERDARLVWFPLPPQASQSE